MTQLKPSPHIVSDRKVFQDGKHKLTIEVENTITRFAWRLSVDEDFSEWTSYYAGVLKHKGYCVTTAYWDGIFPEFVPFKISVPA